MEPATRATGGTTPLTWSLREYTLGAGAAFVGGGTYRLVGTGGPDVGPFSISFDAPGDLVLTSPVVADEWEKKPLPIGIAGDEDIVLRWNPSGSADVVMVQLDGITGVRFCRLEDDGEATLTPDQVAPLQGPYKGGQLQGQDEMRVFRYTARTFEVPCVAGVVGIFFERDWSVDVIRIEP